MNPIYRDQIRVWGGPSFLFLNRIYGLAFTRPHDAVPIGYCDATGENQNLRVDGHIENDVYFLIDWNQRKMSH